MNSSQVEDDEYQYMKVQETLAHLNNLHLKQKYIANFLLTQGFIELETMWWSFSLLYSWGHYAACIPHRALIPWSSAYDRASYARFLPVNYAQMPFIQKCMKPSEMAAFLSKYKGITCLTRLSVDQAFEQWTETRRHREAQANSGSSREQSSTIAYFLST